MEIYSDDNSTPLNAIAFKNFSFKPWPCLVPLRKNELFTSWLVRTAHNHRQRFYSFCSSNFDHDEFWNRDLDCHLPDSILKITSTRSLLSEDQLSHSCLSSLIGFIFTTISKSRQSFIKPINFYSKQRSHEGGLVVCPRCLNKDEDDPYFRKHWRLALTVVCTECGSYLIEKCQKCNAEINFLKLEPRQKSKPPNLQLTCCWNCGFDLRKAHTIDAPDEDVTEQKLVNKYYGDGHILEYNIGYSHLYFLVLKKMISILSSRTSICQELNSTLSDITGIQNEAIDSRRHPFEVLPINLRRGLLFKAIWLLDDWPYRFREITKSIQMHSKFLLQDFEDCPYFFYKEVNEQNRLVYSPWRSAYPTYSYGSSKELLTRQRRNFRNIIM